jgi:hypothetical protein
LEFATAMANFHWGQRVGKPPEKYCWRHIAGEYVHSTGLFGRPTYGVSVTGKVYYPESVATNGCTGINTTSIAGWSTSSAGSSRILMLDRGVCHFVEKVRHAQMVGADAVVIVNNIEGNSLPVMADDGSADDLFIPSVLVTQSVGTSMKLSINAGEAVVVVIQWEIPHPDNRVEFGLWTSSFDPMALS